MSYTFIQEEDYEVQVRQEIIQLLDGSQERSAIIKSERMAIDQIKGFIGGRYDVNAIFSASGNDRDYYIVMITIDIALYHLWSKKAPRKIPEYRSERYQDALDWLKKVQEGQPTNLPQLDAEQYQGDVIIKSKYSANDNKY